MTTTTASANVVSKFKSKFHRHITIVVGIYDATTGILLDRSVYMGRVRSYVIAERFALENAKHFVLSDWACKRWCYRYGITATQFKVMLEDRVIKPLESYTFKVERVEIEDCQTR